MGYFLLALILSAALPAAAKSDRSYFAFPGTAYLDGVGPIVGGAAGVKNVFQEGTVLAAFKTFGKIRGGGVALRGYRVFDDRGTLSVGVGVLEEAEFTTQYGRGYEQRFLLEQVINGYGFGARLRFEPIPDRFAWSAGFSSSLIAFEEYKNRSGEKIPISLRDFKDINTNAIFLGLELGLLQRDPKLLQLEESLTVVGGRVAQSDMALFKTRLHGRREFSGRLRVSFTAGMSNAVIIREVGPGRVDGRCNTVADPAFQLDCQRVEDQITEFVVKSNKVGTSLPLGGSRGLRSYREARFKAAHTGLSGLEVGWTPVKRFPVEVVAFYELGHASDNLAALISRSRYSAGGGVRIGGEELALRAEFSYGHEGGAGFLTFGAPW
ncbi:MAG: hypothetical protein COB53_02745 [Elusimicrobia bacterium]|nr:MAG: hypothetical protein COB53_02745 [Elusimicrobiota bacterium]